MGVDKQGLDIVEGGLRPEEVATAVSNAELDLLAAPDPPLLDLEGLEHTTIINTGDNCSLMPIHCHLDSSAKGFNMPVRPSFCHSRQGP